MVRSKVEINQILLATGPRVFIGRAMFVAFRDFCCWSCFLSLFWLLIASLDFFCFTLPFLSCLAFHCFFAVAPVFRAVLLCLFYFPLIVL